MSGDRAACIGAWPVVAEKGGGGVVVLARGLLKGERSRSVVVEVKMGTNGGATNGFWRAGSAWEEADTAKVAALSIKLDDA